MAHPDDPYDLTAYDSKNEALKLEDHALPLGKRTRQRVAEPSQRAERIEAEGDECPAPFRTLSLAQARYHLNTIIPCRSDEIHTITEVLSDRGDVVYPQLVQGASATGKTLVVKEAVRLLGKPYAYVSCRSCRTPRLIFESILNQLHGHVRSAANRYASFRRCDGMADFVVALPAACSAAISRFRSPQKKKRGRKKKQGEDQAEVLKDEAVPSQAVVFVIDNVEVLKEDGNSTLLASLLRLPEPVGLPNLRLIFVSSLAWDAYKIDTGFMELQPLHFPAYSNEELQKILERNHCNPLYSAFLKVVVPLFSRACQGPSELAETIEPLFHKYSEPVLNGSVANDDKGRLTLYQKIRPFLKHAMMNAVSIGIGGTTEGTSKSAQAVDASRLEFELSTCSKYLLIAAYVASRNPPTLDSVLFDTGSDERVKKRRRRSSQAAQQKKEQEVHEMQMKGPNTFPLERLLHIYHLMVAAEASEPELAELSAPVLMQLATLISTNLISKVGGERLDGGAPYRFNASKELAEKVSSNVRFPLKNYLLQ